MNLRLFLLGILASIVFLNSCNDDLKSLGLTTRPDGDGNSTQADTFYIELSTEKFEHGVYARSQETSLGQMYDPLYGNTKADYLCQFYCEDNFKFYKEPIKGEIDSVILRLRYISWKGDSISPMTAEVYKLTNPLDRDFYSDFDPTKYYTPSDLLASQTYTARNYNITDSLWNVTKNNIANNVKEGENLTYYLDILLPKDIGEKIYKDTKENPEYFANQDAFNKYFPGLYVTTTEQSSGNMLDILDTQLRIHYDAEFTTTSKVTGKDSAYVRPIWETFMPSPEVIQKNRFKHTGIEDLIDKEEYAYAKSMGGAYTKVTIPTASQGLIDKIEGRTINNLFFSVKPTPPEEDEYALQPPEYLLLLPVDSIKPHFEKNRLVDSNTASYSAKLMTDNQGNRIYNYSFGNIANIVTRHMEDASNKDKDIELAIVPIYATEQQNSYGQNTGVINYLEPLLTPAGAQIRKDKDLLKFYITSSKFNE